MTTNPSQAQSVQQGNRTSDGKYAFGTHAEPDGLALSTPPAKERASLHDALEAAGAQDGHAFILYAAHIEDGVGVIELDNEEGTGGELRHRYETGETTWHFDNAGQGSAEDVQIAVDDITREMYNAEELFNRFREECRKQ